MMLPSLFEMLQSLGKQLHLIKDQGGGEGGGVGFDCVGSLTTLQPLWVILCHLPDKGRKKIEEIVKEMKERDRADRETRMKVKKQMK